MNMQSTEGYETNTQAQGLREEVVRTREEIVDAIAQMEHLRLQVIPQIHADYAVKIGCWETQLLQAELSCRRARRKLTLAQASANDGSAIDEAAIETQLDAEFEEWQERMAKAFARVQQGLEYITATSRLSPSDGRALKKYFRILARRLHPDLHPDRQEEFSDLFQIAMRAYETGNVPVLRSLEVSTRHLDTHDADLEGLAEDELGSALELTQIELGMVREQLEKLKADPVFQLERQLASPEWVTAKVTEMRGAIASYDRARENYERRLVQLMGGTS